MHRYLSRSLWAVLLAPLALAAQTVTTEGTLSVGGGTALLNGDRAAFQQTTQHKKYGYGGIEDFQLDRETQDSSFKFDLRLLPGDDNYRVGLHYAKGERFYADAGYERYRVFYDGSGGYFGPKDLAIDLYSDDLSLVRSKLWAEVGVFTENHTYLKIRYERDTREGTKDSSSWGDTNLVSTKYGTRNIVPTFYDLDETTQTVTAEVGNEAKDDVKWHAGASYAHTELDNRTEIRRRPFESAADRYVTQENKTTADIYSANGYYERKVSEQLTVSAGALTTKLDTNLGGSRIYGQSYDPVFDPSYRRRQARDEGFIDLTGDGTLKQTVINLNAVYVPMKNWSVRPSVRYENLHQDTMAEFIETNVVTTTAPATQEEMAAESAKKYDEFTEQIDVRYTGIPNWTFSGVTQWIQGSGNLEEDSVTVENNVVGIDRAGDYSRHSQKYALNANWYAKPGLTFAAQYYFKGKTNDYGSSRDNTPATGGDRYPAYISDQDFETNDLNLRMSWRPASMLSFVTRYDYQLSKVITQQVGLNKIESARYTSHIISESATWNPLNRLYVTGNVNVTFDQLATPAKNWVTNGDNNYINGSLGGGYAVTKVDDLFFDYSWFHASNFIDNSAVTQPYGLNQRQHTAAVTWVRRQNAHLVYTVKYAYVTNRDDTSGGINNYTANVIYGRVQYHF